MISSKYGMELDDAQLEVIGDSLFDSMMVVSNLRCVAGYLWRFRKIIQLCVRHAEQGDVLPLKQRDDSKIDLFGAMQGIDCLLAERCYLEERYCQFL